MSQNTTFRMTLTFDRTYHAFTEDVQVRVVLGVALDPS